MLKLLTEAPIISHVQKNQILLIYNGNEEKRENVKLKSKDIGTRK